MFSGARMSINTAAPDAEVGITLNLAHAYPASVFYAPGDWIRGSRCTN